LTALKIQFVIFHTGLHVTWLFTASTSLRCWRHYIFG